MGKLKDLKNKKLVFQKKIDKIDKQILSLKQNKRRIGFIHYD